ncbi:exonuclease domain-containing protein [Streptomyces sp. NPDC090231]|uniref:exonuclease domain-containing protein n=1 Tax=unclassified Streptomyces TaxID=2593676 RepID=UPI00380B9393
MMWHKIPLCAFDLETTGVDVEADRIVTAAVLGLGGGGSADSYEWLADPGIEIPAEATAVHHITTEHAREHGEPARDVVDQIAKALAIRVRLGDPIVGHNVPYDLTLLDRECRRHQVPTLHDRLGETPLRVLDTRVLDQHCLPYRRRPSETQGPRQLITLAQVYELHTLQIEWAAEQAAGLQEHMRKTNPDAVIDGSWPLRHLGESCDESS